MEQKELKGKTFIYRIIILVECMPKKVSIGMNNIIKGMQRQYHRQLECLN